MSLILDALRKSDHQRARNAAERLRDGPPVAPAPAFPATTLLLLLAIVTIAAVAVIAALLLTGDRTVANGDREAPTAAVRALGTEVTSRRVETPPRDAPMPAPAVENTAPAQAVTADELAAPPLATLPDEMRGRLPPLHVNVHAWAEDPAARFVLINLKRYQEGDRLDEGPIVRHILPGGVVLEFEGTLFSLSRR